MTDDPEVIEQIKATLTREEYKGWLKGCSIVASVDGDIPSIVRAGDLLLELSFRPER